MLRLTLPVPVVLAIAFVATGCGAPTQEGRSPDASAAARAQAQAAFAQLPLTFVENRGQADRRVRFQVQGPGHAFALTPGQIALTLQRPSGEGVALALRFRGADPGVALSGSRRAPGAVNYLRGNDPARWRTGVPGYEEVVYRDLWRGIDLALTRARGRAEVRVPGPAGGARERHPARLPRRDGPAARRRRRAGIGTALGDAADSPPVAYQEIGGVRVPVESRYVLDGDARVRLRGRRLRPRPRADHRPEPGVLDLPRRREPRDRQRHPGRRGRQRLRHRVHPVARPSRPRPARSAAPARRATTWTSS